MVRRRLGISSVCALISIAGCAKAGNVLGPAVQQYPTSFQGKAPGSVLLFQGDSSWDAEVESIAGLLYSHEESYLEVTSADLNSMSLDEISVYNALIVPGGYAPTITAALTADTHEKLRQAVQVRGMDYLGFCAGAWLAVAPAPAPGQDVSYGLGLVNGPLLQASYWTQQGLEFAILPASFPDGTQRDLLWYGGPVTPSGPSRVLVKYPDGTAAISEVWSDKGLVILSGFHPTATQPILNALGLSDTQAIDPDYAWQLLDSVIRQIPLPTF